MSSPLCQIDRLVANAQGIREHVAGSLGIGMVEGEGADSGAPAPSSGPVEHVAGAVFVSYASSDSATAESLCAYLERAGITCWIAPRDVRPGDFYADAIVQAINVCQALVLVLSAHSIASPHVVREVERASSKQRPVIAFRIDATPLPPGLEYFLSTSQWLDASADGAERAYPKLVEAVRRRSAGAAERSSSAPAGMTTTGITPQSTRSAAGINRMLTAAIVVIAAGLVYVLADRFWLSRRAPAAANALVQTVPASAVTPANGDKSVAVLPFTDLSERKDQEYFSDGLSEELIDLLGKIPGLRVSARTSSFFYKGKQTTLGEIASALKVAHVLEGSVRKAGGNVRITADLVRVSDEAHLWSETYDRKLDDIFKLQDEIAGAVVKALKVSLLSADVPKAIPTANIDAYTLYLQGRLLIERYDLADNLKGQEYLQQALKLDPKYAPAWAELSRARFVAFASFGASTYQEARPAVLEAANEALRLDPRLAAAHIALGSMLFAMDWDWSAADREFKSAIELDPGDSSTLPIAGQLAVSQGRYDEARRLAQTAIARDPLQILGYRGLGIASFFAGDLPGATTAFRKAIELSPTSDGLHYKLGLVLLSAGDAQGALAEFEHEPHAGWRRQGVPLALDALGRKADADRALALAAKDAPNGWGFQLAEIYAHRKDLDQAFVWLDHAYQQHDPGLAIYLKGDPLLANVRGDARYNALLRKMQLPQS
ncbi:MAG TPA: TIR domain-containing protein [Steroidobacteraceae bacterium]|nr:TIR domain-containing protein [Steroidobacteraceae bacterium]